MLALTGRGKVSGYEPVFDLLRNAERRAECSHYDDAVARLYRATKLLAQTRLRLQYGLNTSDLATAKLPEPLREPYAARCDPDGTLRLGLQAAYGLLSDLGDPLGTAFISVSGPLNNALVRRNHSILAHGSAPVGQTEYHALHTQLRALIDAARSTIKLGREPAQFPTLTEIAP